MKDIDLTKKYALAVSGGVDSMVMLHKFAALSPRPDFCVVTVNHGIRQEAASDCNFVADYCKKLGVTCHVVSVDVPSFSQQNKLSIETAARVLRYQVFDNLEYDFVCLAHNANDNAETVLMHILRGSGAKGAAGIKQLNGKYFRPILELTREQIECYAKEHNVPFVKDSTNDDVKYTRNYVRHKVMPLLSELNPQAMQNLLRFATNIAQDDDYLDTLVDVSTVEFSGNGARIPTQLLKQPAPIAYRLVLKVFNRLGVFCDVEKTHFDAIVDVACSVGGKSVNLPFSYVAVNDYDYVTICKAAHTPVESFEIPFAIGSTVTPLGVVQVSNKPLPDSLRIDVNKVPKTAVFRVRRQGDVFTKFGGGTKPLKEYLIDKKIPQRKRNKLLLLACDNNVLAVIGVEISESVKVANGAETYYLKLNEVSDC